MSIQSVRGTKRTCQNQECGSRFYDLMRDPIVCPVCQSPFVPVPPPSLKPESAWKTNRNAPRHVIVAPAPVEEADEAEEAEQTTETEDEIAPDKQELILELDELDEDDDAGINGVKNPVTEEK